MTPLIARSRDRKRTRSIRQVRVIIQYPLDKGFHQTLAVGIRAKDHDKDENKTSMKGHTRPARRAMMRMRKRPVQKAMVSRRTRTISVQQICGEKISVRPEAS